MTKRKKLYFLIFPILLLLLVLSYLHYHPEKYMLFHSRVESPDKRFAIELYKKPWHALIPKFPGGGGDAPGVMLLVNAEGRVLEREPIDLLSSIDKAYFEWDNGYFQYCSDIRWKLPDPNNRPAQPKDQ